MKVKMRPVYPKNPAQSLQEWIEYIKKQLLNDKVSI